EAEAKATQMVSDAISAGNPQALNYFIAQKYTEAVQQFATSPNAKTILFPVEATQLIGTLGGIGQLAKDALSADGQPTPTPPAPARRGPFGQSQG
ncbi:MAG: SPFH/Band 7/PHB domain protein, partial [Pseudomonadota bacterium]|nr:SPFH/Band 7/PHB domain protein [Pseudomonadota bacterium]